MYNLYGSFLLHHLKLHTIKYFVGRDYNGRENSLGSNLKVHSELSGTKTVDSYHAPWRFQSEGKSTVHMNINSSVVLPKSFEVKIQLK